MKKKGSIKIRQLKGIMLPENFDEQAWLAPHLDKDFVELRAKAKTYLTTVCLTVYELLRIMRAIDLTDKWKEGGFKTLGAWLMKDFSWTPSKYYRFLRVVRRFTPEIIQRIGFEPLAHVLSANVSVQSLPTLLEWIKQTCEVKGEPPTLREIKTAMQDIATPVERANTKASKLEYLELQLKEARKVIKEKEVKIRQQAERILKLEMTVEDQKRYIQELQQGKRSV